MRYVSHDQTNDVHFYTSYTLDTLHARRGSRVLAKILVIILFLFLLTLFLPWQQNIRGTGNVTALSPMNRPQSVEAIIGGRVQNWFVREGDFVRKGDTIVSIVEIKEKYFDPQLLERLGQQITAKENSLRYKSEKATALTRQITALQQTMQFKIEQTKSKLEAQKIIYQNAENQLKRNKKLYEDGNIALTKYQDFQYRFQSNQAEYQAMELELKRVRAEYEDKISKAESELRSTQSELYEGEAEIAKARNEYANTQIRSDKYQIRAPQDGYVVKAMKAGIGETINEGEAICTIMPEASDLAVEMFVQAMDVPLISKGRKVRIQFDGWPAIQFSGWPSASVGTFGGIVRVIDYVNSKPGQFRILVVPDDTDEQWPAQLRVGSGTKGWVMLDDVPVWYELWRQLNGFPPSLYAAPDEETQSPAKTK
ncbi:MAG TPA: HlyD family efflux transporter periplasmic adaptor subunit [Chryseolinea sp.]